MKLPSHGVDSCPPDTTKILFIPARYFWEEFPGTLLKVRGFFFFSLKLSSTTVQHVLSTKLALELFLKGKIIINNLKK